MEETIECIRNSCIPEDELDRYMIYRLILLSFEKDVKDGAMSFDDYVEAEREAADLCSPFIRVSSISLRRYLKDTCRKEDTVEKTPKPVVIKDEDEIGTCKQCGQPFILNKRGVKSSFCSSRCRVAYYRKQHSYEMTCAYCGKSFMTHKKRSAKYCSPECFYQDRFHTSKKSVKSSPAEEIQSLVKILKNIQDDRDISDTDFRKLLRLITKELESAAERLAPSQDGFNDQDRNKN